MNNSINNGMNNGSVPIGSDSADKLSQLICKIDSELTCLGDLPHLTLLGRFCANPVD